MCRTFKRLLAAGLLFCMFAAAYHAFVTGFRPHNPDRELYPVRGVDVSHWQGEIDWDVLAGQDISFAFIKATEGSTYTDARFEENWMQAQQTGLRVGAYHFFSFDSPGSTQAENFISNVETFPGMLPPVIDVEYYGNKAYNPPPADQVRAELNDMISALEAHYGVSPILYSTHSAYERYLAGKYRNCDIWIRDVFSHPELPDIREWTFWQYTDRAILPGYSGEEKYIDMNVFRGSKEEFARYGT